MSTTQVTPETLTLAHVAKWDGTEMRKHMAHPEMRTAIMEILKGKSLDDVHAAAVQPVDVPVTPTPEEQAAADAEVARLAQVEADRVTAEQAAQELARVAAEEAAKPKKIVLDYQIKDEDGNPIGRPTHLEATSEEEMRQKMIEAHTQATRAFHRLKKQKISFKQPDQTSAPAPMSDQDIIAALQDVQSKDSSKADAAQQRLMENERRKAAHETEQIRQKGVSLEFLKKHLHDFNNCQANVQLIGSYIEENQLVWTLDNLEIAFNALESELAPVVKPVAPVTPVNPAPVTPAPAVATQTTPPAVRPEVIVPAPVTPPANPAPAQPRPGVNGGLVPGQQSGSRPVAKPTGLTAEEIRSWDGPTMRKKMQNPAIRAEIEKFARERNAQRQK